MRILISGTHGFIGRACTDFFSGQAHDVVRLVRTRKREEEKSLLWDPERGEINKEEFEGFDAVVHLAGRSIVSSRWTKKSKQSFFQTRCRDTWLLSEVLRRLCSPPKVLITASAVGIYGSRGEEALVETSSPGQGFLSHLCVHWEKATAAIERRGVRVVHCRFGAVLDPQGGMLKKQLPLFRLGLGATLGSGKQYLSWIALGDLVRIVQHLLHHEESAGPVNVTSPNPVTQKEFAERLAAHLGKRVHLRFPRFLLRLAAGEMADALLLSSQRVYPEKLVESGYAFQSPTLESYFDSLI